MKPNIPELINRYYDTQLKKTNIDLHLTNEKDKEILKKYLIFNKADFKTLRESFVSFKSITDYIKSNSNMTEKVTVFVRGSESEEDSLNYYFNLRFKKFFFNPITNLNYIKYSNTFSLVGNYLIFHDYGIKEEAQEKVMEVFKNKERYEVKQERNLLENTLSTGFNFKFNNLHKELFLSNNSYFSNDYELNFKFSTFRCIRDINRNQTGIANIITLSKNFDSRPFLFRNYPYFDPTRKLSLVLSHRIINNYLNNETSSKQLIAGTTAQDSEKTLGIVYSVDSFQDKDFFNQIEERKNSLIYNFSSSINFINTLNSEYFQTNIFYRQIKTFNDFLKLQTNFEATNTFLIGNTKFLKSNETILVDDFKGVLNPGPKVSKETDSMGMFNIMKFYNKLYFTNTLLNNDEEGWNHKLVPFIHFNLLFHYGDYQKKFISKNKNIESSTNVPEINETRNTNNYNASETTLENQENSNLYASAGFGLTYFTNFCALEVYYNGFVKKNNKDVAQEFGFNIGID